LVTEKEIGTIERVYPRLTPTQAAVELLRESWAAYELWKSRAQFTENYKFLGGAKEIEQAGLTYRKSMTAHVFALTLHDLDKASHNGEISASDKHIVEQIVQSWKSEKTIQKTETQKNLDPYQVGYEYGYKDGVAHKPQDPKPNAIKATLSAAYREQFGKGYKDGHFAGIREVRANELKRMRKADRENERER